MHRRLFFLDINVASISHLYPSSHIFIVYILGGVFGFDVNDVAILLNVGYKDLVPEFSKASWILQVIILTYSI